jgi:molybdopterin/thiamine biosynthesis adenylyltransferase
MKTVVVVGVGARGSHLVQFIRNCEAKIRIIDFDRVEQKNVMSQFHVRNSVGKGKAQSLAQLMQFLFNIKIDTVPHKLVKENVQQLLGNADLIVDCLDNAEARILVQEYARKNKVACLHGALAADGMFGRIIWDENFAIDADASGAATCEDGEHLPFIAQTASTLAKAVQVFLDSGQMVSYHIHPAGAVRV